MMLMIKLDDNDVDVDQMEYNDDEWSMIMMNGKSFH